MRIITPKRDTTTGRMFHYCPVTNQRFDFEYSLPTGSKLPCCDGCEIEQKNVRYIVRNNALSTAIDDFDPPKAHDTYRGLTELGVLTSPVHTWIEPKLDGARAIVHCTPDGVVITTRRRDATGAFKQIQDNVPHLRDHPMLLNIGRKGYAILDGEIIMPVDTDTLAITMGVVGALPAKAIAHQKMYGNAILHVFDMPKLMGKSVAHIALTERVALLQRLIGTGDPDAIRIVEHHRDADITTRQEMYQRFLDLGYEGAVVKNPRAGYFMAQAWLKAKQSCTYDAIVTGWEYGKKGGKYADTIGALKVSVIDAATGTLREICKVTPGDDTTRNRMHMRVINTDDITAEAIVVEMQAQCMTKDGRLRHPRILRYRLDLSEPNKVDFSNGRIVR
jgi:ATP-dependent DNA ligase